MATQLYPIKFHPIFKNRIWGGNKLKEKFQKSNTPDNCGESWEISAVQDNISVVSNGFLADNDLNEIVEIYMGDLVGEAVYEVYGPRFPLLIKFIDAKEDLSVQVHPNDMTAIEKHGENGKTEMWYIIETETDTENITGLSKPVTTEEFETLLSQNRIEEILCKEKSTANDVFFIPGGRIHAVGKGSLFVEIQQTSDITYRLFDYNRINEQGENRELQISDAFDAIDYSQTGSAKITYNSQKNTAVQLIDCPFFTTNLIDFDKINVRNYATLDSFVIYICVEGKCSIHCEENPHIESLQIGETCLIPATANEVELKPITQNVKLLEVYISFNE